MGIIRFGVHAYESVGTIEQFVLSAVLKGPKHGYMVFDRVRDIREGSEDPSDDAYSIMSPMAFLSHRLGGPWDMFVNPKGDVAVAYPALVVCGSVLLKVKGEFSSRKAAVARLEKGPPFLWENPPATSEDILCRCGCR